VGEKLTISGAGNNNYNTTAAIVASVTTTTITNDTITYTFSGAGSLAEGSTAATSTSVTRNYDIIGVHDLWYFDSGNNVKTHALMALTSQGLLFKYDSSGRRVKVPMSGSGATALVSDPARADLRTYNNKLIFCTNGVGNTPKYYDPNSTLEWKDVVGAPDADFSMEHLGRLFMNDKLDPDKLHYCETFDDSKWQGLGDSGALYIGISDGDNVGINCIKPPLKGRLFVCKGRKEYQIVGDAPENFLPQEMTGSVGAASHRSAVSYDYEDVFHVSMKGVHSISATDQYGDFAGAYASRKIQRTFNEWPEEKLNLVQGTYLSQSNSIAWIIPERGATKPNAVWLYNPSLQSEQGVGEWYRWPSTNFQSIGTYLQSSIERPVFGTNAGRIVMGSRGTYTDYTNTPIVFRIKSGAIYPDGNPQTMKAFKKFGLLYKPKGEFSFTAYFSVDNQPAQAVSFAQNVQGDILGTTFTTGVSILGADAKLAPFVKDVIGHGRGCTIEIFQSGIDGQIEIYGFIIEYEPMDVADAVDT
jgi:hypothetical protein